jgi:DeoR/GlpR family transcriptional regulator of sugar metabolism
MLPSERQKKIRALLATKDVVSIVDFVNAFHISIETVRRDLAILEKQGVVEKVYGGAKLKVERLHESTLENRLVDQLSQKKAIGKKCSEFIHDGDCIFLDSGSTTYQIAKNISTRKNLTVITNSIPIINELMNTDFEMIMIGGRVRHDERSVVSFDYLFDFTGLNIQKSFICAGGITVEKGVSDFNMEEAVTRKKIIAQSHEVFVAADSSKFGRNVTINIAPLSQIAYVISDSQVGKNTINGFKKSPAALIIAED